MSTTSPSTNNLSLLQGEIRFHETGGSQRHLGNAPKIDLTPSATTLDHFSSMTPSRKKDKTFTTAQSLKGDVDLEEITPANLALFFGHASWSSGAITIFKDSVVTGALLITGTNDQGNKFEYACPSCEIRPTGTINLITGDAVAKMPLSIEIFYDAGIGGFATITEIVAT